MKYLKTFNESIQDFNIEEIKNKEAEHFERELSYRKKMRSEDDNDYDFNELRDVITDEIDNLKNYYITASKSNEEIYIEYGSEDVGRVKIFNPKDDSDKGYFEVNGKIHKIDADEIRIFYHYLNQLIKNKPILESVENNIFEGTMVRVHFDDWEGLYIDGEIFEEGHSLYWVNLLEKLIKKGIDLNQYKFKSFPRYLTEEDGDELGGSLPKNLIDLYKTLNIEL